ncbi:unnamed protein product [Urochloa humidicola]
MGSGRVARPRGRIWRPGPSRHHTASRPSSRTQAVTRPGDRSSPTTPSTSSPRSSGSKDPWRRRDHARLPLCSSMKKGRR